MHNYERSAFPDIFLRGNGKKKYVSVATSPCWQNFADIVGCRRHVADIPNEDNKRRGLKRKTSLAVIRQRLRKALTTGSCSSEGMDSATMARMSRCNTRPLVEAKRLSRESDGKEGMATRSNQYHYRRGEGVKILSGYISRPLPGSQIDTSIRLSKAVWIDSRESWWQVCAKKGQDTTSERPNIDLVKLI